MSPGLVEELCFILRALSLQPRRMQCDLSLGKLVHSSHQELILADDW